MVPKIVNLEKLKRTIERDFKRNPAKTCVLLALLPVAGYFVGPMLWKVLPGKGSATPTTANGATLAGNPLVVASNDGAKPVLPSWREIAERIAADARMRPIAVAGLRNPFEGEGELAQKLAEQEIEKAKETVQPEPDPRPEDYGLQLTATIVGEHLRLATINGKQYRENSKLPVLDSTDGTVNEKKQGSAFVVKRVAKKYVVLEREGKLYQLQLHK